MKLGKGIAEFGKSRQRVLRLGQQSRRAIRLVSAVETFHGRFHAVTQLFRVLQHLSALLQSLVLTSFQLRLFDLGNLVFQRFHAAQLFAFVHGQGVYLPAQLGNSLIFFAVIPPQSGIVRKAVQKSQVIFFIKQGGGIVLAVDVDKLNAQSAKDRHIDQAAVDTADILAVQMDLPGNHRLRVIRNTVFPEPL